MLLSLVVIRAAVRFYNQAAHLWVLPTVSFLHLLLSQVYADNNVHFSYFYGGFPPQSLLTFEKLEQKFLRVCFALLCAYKISYLSFRWEPWGAAIWDGGPGGVGERWQSWHISPSWTYHPSWTLVHSLNISTETEFQTRIIFLDYISDNNFCIASILLLTSLMCRIHRKNLPALFSTYRLI